MFTGWLTNGSMPLKRMGFAKADESVALKVLEPIELRSNESDLTRASTQAAIRVFALKWQNDGPEQATRAYCTVRQVSGPMALIFNRYLTHWAKQKFS